MLDAVEGIPDLILLIRHDQFLPLRSNDFCLYPDQPWISHRLRDFKIQQPLPFIALLLSLAVSPSVCQGHLTLKFPVGYGNCKKSAARTAVACGGAWYHRAFSLLFVKISVCRCV